MLDQRLVRDNPETIAQHLGRRGKAVDLTQLQLIAQQQLTTYWLMDAWGGMPP